MIKRCTPFCKATRGSNIRKHRDFIWILLCHQDHSLVNSVVIRLKKWRNCAILQPIIFGRFGPQRRFPLNQTQKEARWKKISHKFVGHDGHKRPFRTTRIFTLSNRYGSAWGPLQRMCYSRRRLSRRIKPKTF